MHIVAIMCSLPIPIVQEFAVGEVIATNRCKVQLCSGHSSSWFMCTIEPNYCATQSVCWHGCMQVLRHSRVGISCGCARRAGGQAIVFVAFFAHLQICWGAGILRACGLLRSAFACGVDVAGGGA